jgi:hypothetical protein
VRRLLRLRLRLRLVRRLVRRWPLLRRLRRLSQPCASTQIKQ